MVHVTNQQKVDRVLTSIDCEQCGGNAFKNFVYDPPSGRKGLSLLVSRGRALLSQGRDAAKAALGVDC